MPHAGPTTRSKLLAAAWFALALAACASPGDRPAPDADLEAPVPKAAATPAPVAVTPVRFDAYVLALENIRAAHPQFVQVGENPMEVREEMREAVSRAGLTLEEFRQLHQQVEADATLKGEAERRVAARRQQTGSTSGAAPGAAPNPTPPPPRTAPTPNP
jgi:hypothetical protein